LQILSEKKLRAFYQENINKTEEVLFESYNDHGKMYGFTRNYVKVEIPYNQNLNNELTFVNLQEVNSNGNVLGAVIDKIRFNLKPTLQ
jgi:threonylcarbamoyladenosine tRNA methylthiotransferase MtaB